MGILAELFHFTQSDRLLGTKEQDVPVNVAIPGPFPHVAKGDFRLDQPRAAVIDSDSGNVIVRNIIDRHGNA